MTITASGIARILSLSISLLFAVTSFASDDEFVEFNCPRDVWIECGDNISDLSIYGYATLKTYTGIVNIYAAQEKRYIDNCGRGHIYRIFTAIDPYGKMHTCTQTIWVSGGHYSRYIYWPKDTIITGCDVEIHPNYLEENGWPYVRNESCAQIGTSYNDQEVDFGSGCTKIIRTWTVLDWCEYEPNSSNPLGKYTHVQIIKISNIKEPTVVFPDDITLTARNCKDVYVEFDEVKIDYAACGGDVEIRQYSVHADDTRGPSANGTYPVGDTYVRYEVEYGCGLKKIKTVKVTVNDDVPPVAYCYTYLGVALMPVFDEESAEAIDGMAEIWASDFDKGSYSTCNHGPLSFSFSEDVTDNVRNFSCNHVGRNELVMWVTDAKGNQSSCNIEISVQNNAANIQDCGTGMEEEPVVTTYNVTGNITQYHNESPLEEVEVLLTGINMVQEEIERFDTSYIDVVIPGMDGLQQQMIVDSWLDTITKNMHKVSLTASEGSYSFEQLYFDETYTIDVFKEDENPTKSTFEDYMKLEAHLSGHYIDNNPYFLLAADVDDSGVVDEVDLKLIVEYITGNIDKLPTQNQWLFVDAAYEFTDPSQPGLEEYMQYVEMKEMEERQDHTANFIAINKGIFTSGQSGSLVDGRSTEIEKNSLSVFPNPFDTHIYFTLDLKSSSDAYVQIFDVSGRSIYQSSTTLDVGKHNIKVDANDLLQGVYFYEVNIEGVIHTGKLIK